MLSARFLCELYYPVLLVFRKAMGGRRWVIDDDDNAIVDPADVAITTN